MSPFEVSLVFIDLSSVSATGFKYQARFENGKICSAKFASICLVVVTHWCTPRESEPICVVSVKFSSE